MGALNHAVRRATLLLGHAPFVVRPQVPPPFRGGNQCILTFVRHENRRCVLWLWLHLQFLRSGQLALIGVERQELPRAQVQRSCYVEDVQGAVSIDLRVCRRQAF
jgi:hypothetical protein